MDALASGLHAQEVEELPEYRSLSGIAIVGLLVSLFSPLALVRTTLIAVPVAAAILCVVALVRIRRAEGRLAGKTPAAIGLGLASLFAAAAPAQEITWQRAVHARATPFALAWLETLRGRQPHKAHQLTKPDLTRQPLNDALWPYYARETTARQELEQFVANPVIQLLLTLGEDAQIRFYQPFAIEPVSTGVHHLMQYFAITYEDPSAGRTSLFMYVMIERREGTGNSAEQWRVVDFGGGIRPPGY